MFTRIHHCGEQGEEYEETLQPDVLPNLDQRIIKLHGKCPLHVRQRLAAIVRARR